MNVALIIAGGSGKRFGADRPKQYVEVMGKPIIIHCLDNYEKSPDIDAIEVVCRDEYRDYIWEQARKFGITKLRWVNTSGAEAQDSIRNGVYAMRDVMKDDDILFMHTSVHPMITQEAIRDSIEMARDKGCSFAMYPIRIVMARKMAENWTTQNAFKEDFIELNGPWSFRYGEVYNLYREADRLNMGKSVRDYTLTLWMDMGHRAYYYPGCDIGRMKITTAFDIVVFEAYLKSQQKEAENNHE